jgi:hypothetical protein
MSNKKRMPNSFWKNFSFWLTNLSEMPNHWLGKCFNKEAKMNIYFGNDD